jgi:hypothetical protein
MCHQYHQQGYQVNVEELAPVIRDNWDSETEQHKFEQLEQQEAAAYLVGRG